MIRTISQLSIIGQILGYGALAWGLLVLTLFVIIYVRSLPWRSTPEGRHLVAMSANIGAFFAVYLAQAIWPNMPFREYILLGLLIFLVTNCTVRLIMLLRYLRRRRQASAASSKL